MIYLLLLVLLVCLFFAVMVSKGDWMSPGSLFTLAFCFSVGCAIYNVKSWNLVLHEQAFWVLSGGVCLFVIFSSLVAAVMYTRDGVARARSGGSSPRAVVPVREIRLETATVVVATVLSVLVIALYANSLFQAFARLGVGGEWTQAMGTYRLATASVDDAMYAKLPTYVTYAYQAMAGLAYLMLYVFVNNTVAAGRLNRRTLYCVPIIAMYLASTVLRGGRLPILEFLGAAILMYWILWHRMHGWRRLVNMRALLLVLVVGVGTLFVFSAIRQAVGRTSALEAIDYITQYGGGSIELFDQFMQSPPPSSEVWGKETFRGAVGFLGRRFGIEKFMYSYQLEFRSANGIMIGNVYTAFRYWIRDFGYTGWLVILGFYSVFYGVFYHRVKHPRAYRSFDYSLVVYAFLLNGLMFISIQDMLLAVDLSAGAIFTLVCIRLLGWLLIERPEAKRVPSESAVLSATHA